MMKLVGARVALSAEWAERIDLVLSRGRIRPFDEPSACRRVCDLSGHLLMPGLINSHDHLEFNLFPRLGKGPYPNARSWAKDIYGPSASPIKEHLAIPKRVRLQWGGLKNLLSGVTTVAHHNPYEPAVFDGSFPIRVVRRCGWAHCLGFRHASLSAGQLYRIVTTTAARLLRLRRKDGSIVADLVAARDTGQSPADAVAELRPEIAIVGGRIRLVSAEFAQAQRTSIEGELERGLHPIELEGRGRWFVKMNIRKLLASSVNAIGSEIRLAGRRVGA